MVEHYKQMYAPIVKKQQQQRDDNTAAAAASPTAQVRSGPNGNFVIYERPGNGSGALTNGADGNYAAYAAPSVTAANDGTYGTIYGNSNGHLYGTIAAAAATPPTRPRVPQPSNPMTSTPQRQDATYSNPPPPLPYRPPPPNPYHNMSGISNGSNNGSYLQPPPPPQAAKSVVTSPSLQHRGIKQGKK